MENKEKIEKQLSFDSFKIHICKDSNLQPFLNVFHFQGENIDQEKVGDVFGIIQIQDHSEQSKYLPNIIAQVIKKEFFRLPKRNSQESLELALHKVNAALGDLAQQENINWIGKLHAAIGSLNKETFSFSQTGNAKIFFVRNKKITEITKNLSEHNDNPIKTFANVSSGKVEIGDKILFSTQSIHESLNLADLSRHVSTFSSDEFDNLLHSTLEAEGENVGTIVVNVKKREIVAAKKQKKAAANKNYFGSDKEETENDEEQEELSSELSKDLPLKTPKNEMESFRDEEKIIEKEKKEEEIKTEIKDPISSLEKKEENLQVEDLQVESNEENKEKVLSPFEKQPELFINGEEDEEIEEEIHQKSSPLAKLSSLASNISTQKSFQEKTEKLGNLFSNKKKELGKIITDFSKRRKEENDSALKEEHSPNPKPELLPKNSNTEKDDKTKQKLQNFWQEEKRETPKIFETIKSSLSGFFPRKNLSIAKEKIVQTTNKSSAFLKEKRVLGFVAVAILVFAIGLFAIKFFKNKDAASNLEQELPTEKNQNDSANLPKKENDPFEKIADFNETASQLTADNGKLYALTDEGFFYEYDLHSGTTREIEIGANNPKKYTNMVAMDDLNFIFFLSTGEIISYNRVTEAFEKHNISLPENLDLVDTGVKGTYLYVADKNSGQIYRYPRSESNGFGSPKLWLANETDFSKATDIAIDDSIYVSYSDGKIEKYFKYKLERSFLLESDPKIIPDKITTLEDFPFYYVLDQKQGIAAKINKETNKVEEVYQSSSLKEAKDIYLESEEQRVFVLTKNSLLRLK